MNEAMLILFIFGLMVGSFLNVCIWRLPEEEQVIRGRSHCRFCSRTIRWYDNIPLISFIILRGRCRHCRAVISWQYPLVELSTALLFLAVAHQFGFTAKAFVYALLGAALLLVAVIDAREMIIPTEVTGPGLIAGIGLSFLFPQIQGTSHRWAALGASILGIVAGGGFLWVTAKLGGWVFREKLKSIGEEEAMGQGDIWLMAMAGSFLGWGKVLMVNLFLAPFLGSLIGVIVKYKTRKDLIPYGPFLVAGTIIALFWGDVIIHGYQSFFIRF